MTTKPCPLKGVNLGGWLVIEKWITPSLFDGLDAQDEYTLSATAEGRGRITHHRENFITSKDFEWMARVGVEAVRLPVGYWLFGGEEAYIESRKFVDYAFSEAEKHGLKVILDLHGAPGSQNGNDHSGRSGKMEWNRADNITKTLTILELIAKEYGQQKSLVGIEILNEPEWALPIPLLEQFYVQAYKTVREIARPDVWVIVSDAFRPGEWMGRMTEADFPGLVFDMHLYQAFSESDRQLSLNGHLVKAQDEWGGLIADFRKFTPVIIGEWSVALHSEPGVYTESDSDAMQYAAAQLSSLNMSAGWFFWTLKTESSPYWSFKDCVERGIISL